MIGYRASLIPFILNMFSILAQFCSASGAEELGRLFTTPEERGLLDKLRNPPMEDTAIVKQGADSNDVTVKGLVYHKNGRGTIWLNNSHIGEQQLQIKVDANNAGDVLIKIQESKAVIRLRPEEVYHPYTKE